MYTYIMKREIYETLMQKGYFCLCDEEEIETYRDKYTLIDLADTRLKDFLFLWADLEREDEEGNLIFYKAAGTCMIKARDFLPFVDVLDEDKLQTFFARFEMRDGAGNPLFGPSLDELQLPIDDYFFNSGDSALAYVLLRLKSHQGKGLDELIDACRLFLIETTQQADKPFAKRHFSTSTLSFILQNIGHILGIAQREEEESPKEAEDFYREYLPILAKRGDYESIRMLGYDYYEGCDGFPLDPKESLYWLNKAYEMKQDPEIARTLGYIYYYGRANNGVPEGDKAFQYFSIGHHAGRYFEATYKLADCYLHGYGTPRCEQAAFNLVNDIYEENRKYFLNGDDYSKFADVALRLGSYYRDGVYVEKDLQAAYHYYLEARAAIRHRLKKGEYAGDKGVAAGIFRSIQELQKDHPMPEREYHQGRLRVYCGEGDGFLMFYPARLEMELVDDHHLHLRGYGGAKHCSFLNLWGMGYFQRIQDFDLYLEGNFQDAKEILKDLPNANAMMVFDSLLVFGNVDKDDYEDSIAFERLEIGGKEIEEDSRRFTLVRCEFSPGGKTYDYLLKEGTAKVGDTLYVLAREESKPVKVTEVFTLYEDELPMPSYKMAFASKPYRA